VSEKRTRCDRIVARTEGGVPMDTSTLIWIIVGIIVVAVIIAVVVMSSRRRAEHQRQVQHDKAEKLREEARQAELAAREREAKAAQVRADSASAAAEAEQAKARAAQAQVEADRLADSVGEHDSDAAKQRQAQADALRKADQIDPLVNADGSRSQTQGTRTTAEMPTTGTDGRAPGETHNTAPDGVGGTNSGTAANSQTGTDSRHGDPVIASETTTDSTVDAQTRPSGDERRV
jgi:FtsZ-interacting cell division protein ZipA